MSAVIDILKWELQRMKKDEEHFRNSAGQLKKEQETAEKALASVRTRIAEVEEELSIR